MKQKIIPILPVDAAKRLAHYGENIQGVILGADEDSAQAFRDILGWHKWHDVSANDPLKVRWAAFSKLVGFEPQFVLRTGKLNACWAFDYKGIFAFVYLSKKGLSLDVDYWMDTEEEEKIFKVSQILQVLHEMVGPSESERKT